MKKIFTLAIALGLFAGANAQYCGSSSPSSPAQCTVSGTMTEPGLSPNSDSLPPVINGVEVMTTIQFKNFDTLTAFGQLLTIESLQIDSINNLPDGLCWATNKSDNTYSNQEEGCIQIHGTTCQPTGSYKLSIKVLVDVGFGAIPYDADEVGLKYFVRVLNNGDAVPPVDTSQNDPFVPYGPACIINSVNELSTVNTLNIVPNPFTNSAAVTFYSEKSSVMTERITNMLGAVVSKNTINVKAGENSSVINGTNFNAGVYFYSLTDGSKTITKRIVISE